MAGSELTLIEKLTQSLARISDVASIVELLVRALDPSKHSDVSEDMDSEGTGDYQSNNVLSAIGGLLTSFLIESLLIGGRV